MRRQTRGRVAGAGSGYRVALARPTQAVARLLALLPLVAAAGAGAPGGDGGLAAVAWLAGCWMTGAGDDVTEEVWLAPRGGLMVAVARSVRDGRAAGHELLLLRAGADGLGFTAVPSGQEATEFRVLQADATRLRVVNPSHDFPQKIEYAPDGSEGLRASVFAGADDAVPAFALDYRRSVCPGS